MSIYIYTKKAASKSCFLFIRKLVREMTDKQLERESEAIVKSLNRITKELKKINIIASKIMPEEFNRMISMNPNMVLFMEAMQKWSNDINK